MLNAGSRPAPPPNETAVARHQVEYERQLDEAEAEDAAAAELDALGKVKFTTRTDDRGKPFVAPDRLWRLDLDKAFAVVKPPLHVQWSGPTRAWDLSDRHDRARAYEILLREGTAGELWRYVDGALLIDF